jgi:hypothetical protein
MFATAIAAAKISFDTLAMITFSATLSTRRRLDYWLQIPSHFGLWLPRNSVMHLQRRAAGSLNIAKLPALLPKPQFV